MSKQKSLGLTILGWFEIVIGLVLLLIVGFWIFYILSYMKAYSGENFTFYNFIELLPHTATIILPVVTLSQGIGVIKRKQWAWRANVYVFPVVYYCSMFAFWKWDSKWFGELLPILAFFFLPPIFITVYFARTQVKAQFFKD